MKRTFTTMKNRLFLIITIISLFLLTACNNDNKQAEKQLDFDFIQHIGVSFDNIYKEMGLNEDDLVQSKGAGRYDYADTITYDNYDFTKYLLFGKYNGFDSALYGGGYMHIAESKDEKYVKLVREIKSKLIEQYGKPSTYPGLPNTIESIGNLADCKFGDTFKDTWSIAGDVPGEITLSLSVLEKGLNINIIYNVSVTR